MNRSVDCPLSTEALWSLCLETVRARRAGRRSTGTAGGWASPGPSLAGALDAEATELLRLLQPVLDAMPDGAPWVIGQLGQSIDGCVATHTGDSNFVGGPQSLRHLHRLRALCDAVIVGAGTVAADDPQLTTRHVEGAHPTRVVIDPALRLPPTARVYTDGQAPTLVVCEARLRAAAHARHGARNVIALDSASNAPGSLDPADIVAALHQRGLQVLLVEGGGVTVSRFLARGCLDRLHLAVSPVLIGGGRPGLQLPAGSGALGDCQRPIGRVFHLGVDVLWDLDLRPVRGSCSEPGH